MKRFLAALALAGLLAILIATAASAGEATVYFDDAPGIAGSEVAIGSCQGDAYGIDVPDPTSGRYARVAPGAGAPDRGVLFQRLEQGETFCFRVRHFFEVTVGSIKYAIPGGWLFAGSKRIPLDSENPPIPVMPAPPAPVNGSVE